MSACAPGHPTRAPSARSRRTGGLSASGPTRTANGAALAPSAFAHCIQNHDQVGSRALGDRMVAPYTPLLFMEQEWNALTPFRYSTDPTPSRGTLVTEGRRAELAGFSAYRDPAARARIPDPPAEETFLVSELDWSGPRTDGGGRVLELHRALLRLRATESAMRDRSRRDFDVGVATDGASILLCRAPGASIVAVVVALRRGISLRLGDRLFLRGLRAGREVLLTTDDVPFGGLGAVPAPEGEVVLREAGAVVLRSDRR